VSADDADAKIELTIDYELYSPFTPTTDLADPALKINHL
jgi:hypothetical protein